jgi:hypothetical protein
LGEEIKEPVIVQKILRSLPMRFDPNISSLEEREDLSMLSMDELHGIFTTYEMRIERRIHPGRKQLSKHPRRQRRRIRKIQSQIAVATMIQMKMKKWKTL